MTSFAAQLLNELMGSDRNTNPNEKKREIRFDDPEICKYFLCGFCPHDLFTNTRADLGICGKIHDEAILKKYRASSRFEKMGYEEDFLRFLQSLLSEVEKRIRKGHARLSLNSTVGSMMGGPQVEREEKIAMLTEKVNELVEQAEQLGCEGKVEEAQGVMKLCEQLKEERSQLQAQVVQRPDHATTKDMEVCEICGALLVVGDAQQRIDEHIMGKQHMGYAQIRSYIEKYKQRQQGEESERMERLQKEREDREKEREKERIEREQRRKEREKERHRDKEDRRRHRSRSRSRDRHRRRSRSRDRHRRSRSRSRHRRSRSRDRDRRRRSRSRSHGYSRSSRDKDRRRSRSRSRKSRDKDNDRDRHRDDRRAEKTKEISPRDKTFREGTPSADKD